ALVARGYDLMSPARGTRPRHDGLGPPAWVQLLAASPRGRFRPDHRGERAQVGEGALAHHADIGVRRQTRGWSRARARHAHHRGGRWRLRGLLSSVVDPTSAFVEACIVMVAAAIHAERREQALSENQAVWYRSASAMATRAGRNLLCVSITVLESVE